MLQMTHQVQARATERAAQLGAMVTSADNLRLELEIGRMQENALKQAELLARGVVPPDLDAIERQVR